MAAVAAVKAVGVLGAGQMGSGIAQLAAAAGRRVVLQVRAALAAAGTHLHPLT